MSSPDTEHFTGSALLLALCPLLAVSDTVVNALGLAAAILIIVPLATVALTSMRGLLSEESRLAASMLLVAGIAACSELLMRAYFHDLRESLGIYLPLVASNLVIIEHLQTEHAGGGAALRHSFKVATVIAVILLVLGIARELVGRGSLLHGAGSLLGDWAGQLETKVFPVDLGFLLAMLPPGAFISLGLLIAARNWLLGRR